MQITNTLNLPAAFIHAVSTERHNAPHCYSATTLNKGAKEIVLTDRHYDEITVDASEQIPKSVFLTRHIFRGSNLLYRAV